MMAFGVIVLIALALAMDAFTVSISCGVSNLARWTKEQDKDRRLFWCVSGADASWRAMRQSAISR